MDERRRSYNNVVGCGGDDELLEDGGCWAGGFGVVTAA